MTKVFYEALEIVSAYYGLAALTVLVHCFYDNGIQWNTRKKIMLFIWVALIEIIDALYGINFVAAVLFMVVFGYVFLYGSKGKWFRRLTLSITVVFRNMLSFCILCDIAFYCLIPHYQIASEEIKDWAVVVLNCVGIIVYGGVYYYLTNNFIKKDIFVPFRKREKWLVAFYTFYLFVIWGMIILSEEDALTEIKSAVQAMLGLAVVVLGVLFPLYLCKNRVSGYYKEQKEYQEEFLQAELLHFQQYKEAQEETRRFRHDIRNHLECLDMLLKEDKTFEAKMYLESLSWQVKELSPCIVTGDEMVDCIVAAKYSQMQQENIVFQIDGVLDGGLAWKAVDICCVFANALDNAIEACRKLSSDRERRIAMTIKRTGQFYSIDISNTVAGQVNCERLLNKQVIYTTKENQNLHGFGISNMQRTVERYGGMMKLSCTDSIFNVSFIVGR